jgi:hypothetical protein
MVNPDSLVELIRRRLDEFYSRRINSLANLKLKKVLKKKNPYLYKARGTQSADEIIKGILNDHLSSSDEGMFGDAFFEPLALDLARLIGGTVSPSEGVDIAIETKITYKAIAVKSGPNIFNASQARKQNQEFMSLRSRLAKLKKDFDAVLGHAYGTKKTPADGNKIYRSSSGQAFWEELTGDAEFYLRIIRLMNDEDIAQHRAEFEIEYDKAVNRYLAEFIPEFCDTDGSIAWDRLLEYNSGKTIGKAMTVKAASTANPKNIRPKLG